MLVRTVLGWAHWEAESLRVRASKSGRVVRSSRESVLEVAGFRMQLLFTNCSSSSLSSEVGDCILTNFS